MWRGPDYLLKDDFSYEARRSSNQDGLACVKLDQSKTFSFLLKLVLFEFHLRHDYYQESILSFLIAVSNLIE